MNYRERLNAWHLELAIAADAVYEVLTGIEGGELSATAHVVKVALVDMVEKCPFPCDDDVAELVPVLGGGYVQAD